MEIEDIGKPTVKKHFTPLKVTTNTYDMDR